MSQRFNDAIRKMGMNQLEVPIFYHAPIGIRFEIGGAENVYLDNDTDENIVNPTYVADALYRAKTIYDNLPKKPDILRIDGYLYEDISEDEFLSSLYKETNLQIPNEIVAVPFQWEEDDEVITQLQLYWNLNENDLSIVTLLEEIIKADIGGYHLLSSSVFFADTENAILFYLYDDRGADLVAESKASLYPIFKKFNDWILDYDREKVNMTFAK